MAQTKILAIDPGYGRLGLAVGTDDGRLLSYDLIKTEAWNLFESRLLTIYEKLERIILYEQINILVYEEPGKLLGRNAYLLPQVLGCMNLLIAKYDLKSIKYTPTEMKQLVTGKGTACKTLIEDKVLKTFNLTRKEFEARFGNAKDDVCDSLGVFLAYCKSHNIEINTEMVIKNENAMA
jgi:Holliday junction resolvasome RuvABC endonuclease subunit